jgi:hypothetical protein
MTPLRPVANFPSAAAHVAWMCVVAAVAMCSDSIITVTRCNLPPLHTCIQYHIGHSSVTVAPLSAVPLLQLSAGSWQVLFAQSRRIAACHTPAALLRIGSVILRCTQVLDTKRPQRIPRSRGLVHL